MNTPFKIEHLDSLGQGVSKNAEKVVFIKKTLPGESGSAEILKSVKGVHFAKVKKIDHKSEQRTTPECPHFESCHGCDYLHTTYENEFQFKSESFRRIFSFLNLTPEYFLAKQRLHYRNRIQLHYQLEKSELGFINPLEKKIIAVPECQIAETGIAKKIQELYQTQNWKKLVKKNTGHIEIASINNEIRTNIDERYAQDGFTQVNPSMNQVLISYLEQILKKHSIESVLELFAGDGNLTQNQNFTYHLLVDYYTKSPANKPSLSTDLYAKNAINQVKTKLASKKIDLLLLDPPRAGFKDLKEWVECFSPRFILYVSCDPQTLARDLKSLKRPYQTQSLAMFDLFPSTHHFESVCLLSFH